MRVSATISLRLPSTHRDPPPPSRCLSLCCRPDCALHHRRSRPARAPAYGDHEGRLARQRALLRSDSPLAVLALGEAARAHSGPRAHDGNCPAGCRRAGKPVWGTQPPGRRASRLTGTQWFSRVCSLLTGRDKRCAGSDARMHCLRRKARTGENPARRVVQSRATLCSIKLPSITGAERAVVCGRVYACRQGGRCVAWPFSRSECASPLRDRIANGFYARDERSPSVLMLR